MPALRIKQYATAVSETEKRSLIMRPYLQTVILLNYEVASELAGGGPQSCNNFGRSRTNLSQEVEAEEAGPIALKVIP